MIVDERRGKLLVQPGSERADASSVATDRHVHRVRTTLGSLALTIAFVGVVTTLAWPIATQEAADRTLLDIGLTVVALMAVTALVTAVVIVRRLRLVTNINRWLAGTVVLSTVAIALLLLAGQQPSTSASMASRGFCLIAGSSALLAFLVELERLHRRAAEHQRAIEDEALGLLREKRILKGREDRLRRIIENAADAWFEVDRHGHIRGWNGKATELFGYTASQAAARTLGQLLPTACDDDLGAIHDFWTAADRHDGRRRELTIRRADCAEFPVELTMWVDDTGDEPRLNFFARDITARRDAEHHMERALVEEREAVLRLQELDRVKSNFVSSISHEFRSPLTNTLGYLELLADGGGGELTVDQARFVDVAERNAKRLLGLIEDLLTLARIESGSFSARFRPIDVAALVGAAMKQSTLSANDRHVVLALDLADVLGVCVGDEHQIGQALDNVIGNAVKFTPPEGRVDVRVRRLGDELVVVVADTGIGIPADEQAQLFERFYRTTMSVEQQHQGAGLGLTISKAIVEHHGGTIGLESTVGIGTTVTLRLPLLPLATPAPTPPVAPAASPPLNSATSSGVAYPVPEQPMTAPPVLAEGSSSSASAYDRSDST